MPRSKGQDGKAGAVRAELEAVILELVDCEEVMPLVRLRIEQGIRRGQDGLLSPALDDIKRMMCAVERAKSTVRGLMEQ